MKMKGKYILIFAVIVTVYITPARSQVRMPQGMPRTSTKKGSRPRGAPPITRFSVGASNTGTFTKLGYNPTWNTGQWNNNMPRQRIPKPPQSSSSFSLKKWDELFPVQNTQDIYFNPAKHPPVLTRDNNPNGKSVPRSRPLISKPKKKETKPTPLQDIQPPVHTSPDPETPAPTPPTTKAPPTAPPTPAPTRDIPVRASPEPAPSQNLQPDKGAALPAQALKPPEPSIAQTQSKPTQTNAQPQMQDTALPPPLKPHLPPNKQQSSPPVKSIPRPPPAPFDNVKVKSPSKKATFKVFSSWIDAPGMQSQTGTERNKATSASELTFNQNKELFAKTSRANKKVTSTSYELAAAEGLAAELRGHNLNTVSSQNSDSGSPKKKSPMLSGRDLPKTNSRYFTNDQQGQQKQFSENSLTQIKSLFKQGSMAAPSVVDNARGARIPVAGSKEQRTTPVRSQEFIANNWKVASPLKSGKNFGMDTNRYNFNLDKNGNNKISKAGTINSKQQTGNELTFETNRVQVITFSNENAQTSALQETSGMQNQHVSRSNNNIAQKIVDPWTTKNDQRQQNNAEISNFLASKTSSIAQNQNPTGGSDLAAETNRVQVVLFSNAQNAAPLQDGSQASGRFPNQQVSRPNINIAQEVKDPLSNKNYNKGDSGQAFTGRANRYGLTTDTSGTYTLTGSRNTSQNSVLRTDNSQRKMSVNNNERSKANTFATKSNQVWKNTAATINQGTQSFPARQTNEANTILNDAGNPDTFDGRLKQGSLNTNKADSQGNQRGQANSGWQGINAKTQVNQRGQGDSGWQGNQDGSNAEAQVNQRGQGNSGWQGNQGGSNAEAHGSQRGQGISGWQGNQGRSNAGAQGNQRVQDNFSLQKNQGKSNAADSNYQGGNKKYKLAEAPSSRISKTSGNSGTRGAADQGVSNNADGAIPVGSSSNTPPEQSAGPIKKPCSVAPVCGSDGFTYMSECFIWSGVSKACDGFCPCKSQGPPPTSNQAPPSTGSQSQSAQGRQGPPQQESPEPLPQIRQGLPPPGRQDPPRSGRQGPPPPGPPPQGKQGPPYQGRQGPQLPGRQGPPPQGKQGPPPQARQGPQLPGRHGPPPSGRPGQTSTGSQWSPPEQNLMRQSSPIRKGPPPPGFRQRRLGPPPPSPDNGPVSSGPQVSDVPPTCNCPNLYRPVCSVKGRTYDNDCLRRCNYEGFKCQGECPCGKNSIRHQANDFARPDLDPYSIQNTPTSSQTMQQNPSVNQPDKSKQHSAMTQLAEKRQTTTRSFSHNAVRGAPKPTDLPQTQSTTYGQQHSTTVHKPRGGREQLSKKSSASLTAAVMNNGPQDISSKPAPFTAGGTNTATQTNSRQSPKEMRRPKKQPPKKIVTVERERPEKEVIEGGAWSDQSGGVSAGGASQCGCNDLYAPVCGTNGITYTNPCELSCFASVGTACNGQCPCDPFALEPVYFCEDYCSRIYQPVCSVWGYTFDNDCFRQCSNEAKDCNGECPCPATSAQYDPQPNQYNNAPAPYDPQPNQYNNAPAPYDPQPGPNQPGAYQPAQSNSHWNQPAQYEAHSNQYGTNPNNFNNEPSNQPLSTCECLPGDIDPVCSTHNETIWYGCQAICRGVTIACSSECPC